MSDNCYQQLRLSSVESVQSTDAKDQKMKIRIEQNIFMGGVWIGAWLSTIDRVKINAHGAELGFADNLGHN